MTAELTGFVHDGNGNQNFPEPNITHKFIPILVDHLQVIIQGINFPKYGSKSIIPVFKCFTHIILPLDISQSIRQIAHLVPVHDLRQSIFGCFVVSKFMVDLFIFGD